MSPLTHEDIQELLGAYALHAVDPDEAELVERHLETCPRCRAEVEGHREVATHAREHRGRRARWPLGPHRQPARGHAAAHAPRPPGRRGRRHAAGDPPTRSGATGSSTAALGAAAALAIAVLGAQVVRQQDQLDDMESALEETTLEAAANRAFDDPDAVKLQLQSVRRRGDGAAPSSSPTAAAS